MAMKMYRKGVKLLKNFKEFEKQKEFIRKLPTKRNIPENFKICPICFTEMKEAKKLNCGHLFHEDCLM